MKNTLPYLFLLICFLLGNVLQCELKAQNYWVFLSDKNGVTFDPYSYFDNHTIERRKLHGMPVDNITDYPVRTEYIDIISKYADSVGYASRWFNAVAVTASDINIRAIEALPFVLYAEPSTVVASRIPAYSNFDTLNINDCILQLVEKQVKALGIDKFREAGIDGTGIRIAVFDAGFPGYSTNPVFEHLNDSGRIVKTYDFTRNRINVDRGMNHGTMVLSCITGILQGKPLGLATGSSFLLAITEMRTEPFKEEQFWLAAAEWADKNGADIINSSLGYTKHRYFNDQMDGKSTFVTRAANMAAAKGMLVINAAGNEGWDRWKIVGAPADADSVLAVGALRPETHLRTYFSSTGPTYDRRIKPNVMAYGRVAATKKRKMSISYGTSFASPLIAGFAACAWQTDRSLNNMELFKKIEKSSHLYPYYDYDHGYGIPNPKIFLSETDTTVFKTYNVTRNNAGTVIIEIPEFFKITFPEDSIHNFDHSGNNNSDVQIDADYLKKTSNLNHSNFLVNNYKLTDNYLYINVQSADGVIDEYLVIDVFKTVLSEPLSICVDSLELKENQILCVHYRGYTQCVPYRKAK